MLLSFRLLPHTTLIRFTAFFLLILFGFGSAHIAPRYGTVETLNAVRAFFPFFIIFRHIVSHIPNPSSAVFPRSSSGLTGRAGKQLQLDSPIKSWNDFLVTDYLIKSYNDVFDYGLLIKSYNDIFGYGLPNHAIALLF